MSKYRAYLTINQYRAFEFEADDIDLAFDHMEHLIDHRGLSFIINEATESGPDDIYIEEIEEI
jgi:hypothetical protein